MVATTPAFVPRMASDSIDAFLPAIVAGDLSGAEALFSDGIDVYDHWFGHVTDAAELKKMSAHFREIAGAAPRLQTIATRITKSRVFTEQILLVPSAATRKNLELGFIVIGDKAANGKLRQIRLYYTRWPFGEKHSVRPPINEKLWDGPHPDDVLAVYWHGLTSGSWEAISKAFEADMYFREPSGPPYVHWGYEQVKAYYGGLFSSGAMDIRDNVVTDDGVCAAVEFTVYSFGGNPITPQSGCAVYERGRSGLLMGVRIYDDIEFATD